MAKTMVINRLNFSNVVNTTEYFYISGSTTTGQQSTTETFVQTTIRTASTVSNLRLFISAETLASDATLRTRVNAGNGAQAIAYQATGEFEDTTNSDSLSAGDELNYQNVPPATNSAVFQGMQLALDVGGTTVQTIIQNSRGETGSLSGFGLSTASLTAFWAIGAYSSAFNGDSVESRNNTEQRKTGTFKNLQMNISSNARTTTTVFRTRKNAGNGNLSISFTTETGILGDDVNSDSVVATDDYNFSTVTGTGTETCIALGSVVFEDTANGISEYAAGTTQGNQFGGTATTTYFGLSGPDIDQTTETSAQSECKDAITFSEMTFNVSANSMDAGETNLFTFRENATGTTLLIANTPGQTGIISDSVNSNDSVATDLVAIQLNPAGGAGDNVTIRTHTIYGLSSVTPPAAVADEERYLAVNTIPLLSQSPFMHDLLVKIGGSRTNVQTFKLDNLLPDTKLLHHLYDLRLSLCPYCGQDMELLPHLHHGTIDQIRRTLDKFVPKPPMEDLQTHQHTLPSPIIRYF